MERHKCKLCFRSFANGRALGGHMRSHMMNLQVPPKIKQQEYQEEEEQEKNDHQLISEEMESLAPSSSSASSSSEEEEEVEEEEIGKRGLMSKRFRKKQRKRCSLVDPEFSFAVEATGSVVLQDGESETESSKKSICRRSKRIRKSRISDTRGFSGYYITEEEPHVDKSKSGKEGKSPTQSPSVEHEPVSSISDTTPEEDVAYCLMMLSRDKWNEERYEYEEEEEEDEEESQEEKETKKDAKDHCHDSGAIKVTKSRNRGKYRCETCKKVFRSYQALGGHRASHKRIKVNNKSSAEESAMVVGSGNAAASCTVVEEKIHECPVCYRVFPSGQALGGHKRSHVIGVSSANISISSKPFSRFGEILIDLNLPAPMDDEDIISQVELSAVSDAEFVNPITQ